MPSRPISLDTYAEFCAHTDFSPGHDPTFIDFYSGRLGRTLRIVGKFDESGQLVAAFPTLYRVVFPSSLHKRLLGKKALRLGDFGQPEGLFPVLPTAERLPLNHLSLATSPLLAGRIRGLEKRSLRRFAIAREQRHKKVTIRQKKFLESDGRVLFTDSMAAKEFADIYVRLYGERWGYDVEDLRFVREQILGLYGKVLGVVLLVGDEPVAAQLCFRAVGKSLLYVDFVNSGVRLTDEHSSFGSIMMLTTLRRAEDEARSLGLRLRFSFGYFYGTGGYKSIWTAPEAGFVGY